MSESVKEVEPPPANDQSSEHSDELSQNGFIRLNTHDTSFTSEHIPRIETFAEDLQAAINAVWPSRGRSRYSEVHVLLLNWEEDNLGVEAEIQRLGTVFSNFYRYEVQEFKIPSKTPGKATTKEVSRFLEQDGPDSLLIFYYAGHTRLSHQANDPPIWVANASPKSPTLPSGGVQQLLEEAESDVLLLYDSCHSSHPAINVSGQGVTEVIAACGFETQAPIVGPHSFTNALIHELEESFAGPPISIAELHSRMIGSLKQWKPGLLRDEMGNVWIDADGRPRRECHKRRTPIHCFLTNETPYRSIMLSPLPARLSQAAIERLELEATSDSSISPSRNGNQSGNSVQEKSSAPTSISVRDPAHVLQVLLAVRLEEDFLDADDPDNVRTWCEWLRNIPQRAKDIKIQGVYRSLSTLMIISIPAVVWSLLPNHGAYSFIGFVRSDNLGARLQYDKKVSIPEEDSALSTSEKRNDNWQGVKSTERRQAYEPAFEKSLNSDTSSPTKGQPWSFPQAEFHRIRSAARPSRETGIQQGTFVPDSHRSSVSMADPLFGSQHSTESSPGEWRLVHGMPFGHIPRESSEFQAHHHNSLQHKQLADLQDARSGSLSGTQFYSHTPELRVSRKLAERQRRNEMQELFETLRNLMLQERGSKVSKFDILTKAISEFKRLQDELQRSQEMIRLLSQEAETLRREANALSSELSRFNLHGPHGPVLLEMIKRFNAAELQPPRDSGFYSRDSHVSEFEGADGVVNQPTG